MLLICIQYFLTYISLSEIPAKKRSVFCAVYVFFDVLTLLLRYDHSCFWLKHVDLQTKTILPDPRVTSVPLILSFFMLQQELSPQTWPKNAQNMLFLYSFCLLCVPSVALFPQTDVYTHSVFHSVQFPKHAVQFELIHLNERVVIYFLKQRFNNKAVCQSSDTSDLLCTVIYLFLGYLLSQMLFICCFYTWNHPMSWILLLA